jgi:hypothetical protein
VAGSAGLQATLLPGAQELLEMHARELPQRDDLCGAFCASLALHAAGVRAADGSEIDQDEVALAAGSVIAAAREPGTLPAGEPGRRDYRLALPAVDDEARSGTTAQGIVDALAALGGGSVQPVPLAGPWTAATLAGTFELAAGLQRPATLLANLATHHLWGSRATLVELLAFLMSGEGTGPPPDWDVGHFACVVGRVEGPGGRLYALADTYPSLGGGGVHMQPEGRLAAAIARPDMPSGGVVAVVAGEDAETFRRGVAALGLRESIWDNGTASPATRT